MWDIQYTVKKGKYLYAVVPDHPKATKHGYVLHHRVVMENTLNRLLMDDEVVHHKDEDRYNNHPDNLEVMTRSEHAMHHAVRAGVVYLICPFCGESFTRPVRRIKRNRVHSFCSRSCNAKFTRSQGKWQGREH